MHLGAMIDLGVDAGYLKTELGKLDLDGYQISVRRAERKGITGTKVDVITDSHNDHYPHRTFSDIQEIIEGSALGDRVKKWSMAIFLELAQAEAKVHGKGIDEIHFHEVGAIDSIVDIVGAAICRDRLDVDTILCSPIEVGKGFVDCAHGRLPVPAPATAEILQNVPIRSDGASCELTTPTGAAIAAVFSDEFTVNKNFTILKTAYGVGERDTDIPNLLRVFLGETDDDCCREAQEKVIVIETNIDDMNPELYEHVIDRLLTNGAKDASLTPIIMKKSRPAIQISVLCGEEDVNTLTDILFEETTTLGVRKYRVQRTMLDRKVVTVETPYGPVDVKVGMYRGTVLKFKPEYDQCTRLAVKHGLPLTRVYEIVREAYDRTGRAGSGKP